MNDYLYDVARRLVAFDTVSAKSDRDAMEYIAAELAPRGFKTAIQPSNCSASRKPTWSHGSDRRAPTA